MGTFKLPSDRYDDYPWHICNLLQHIAAALSIFGSGCIMCEVLLDKKKRKMTYHRIVFALSFFDFHLSLWFFIGEWAQPADWVVAGPHKPPGTIATCNASGFFIYLGSLIIPAYNCVLSVYYYLTINRNWREQRLHKKFEVYCHPIIVSLCTAIAILPIPLELYNNWYFYCFPVHTRFVNISRGTKLGGDCFRLLYLVVVFAAMIVNVCLFGSIYYQYKKVMRRTRRFEVSSHINSFRSATPSSSFNGQAASQGRATMFSSFYERWKRSKILRRQRNQHESAAQKRSRNVLTMALLYICPFTLTWFIPVVIFLFTHLYWNQKIPIPSYRTQFVGQVYVSAAAPLQGFFNWVIYIRPRYLEYRKKNLSLNGLGIVLKQVFCRLLNRADSEIDEDWLLGSGFDVVEFETEEHRLFNNKNQLLEPNQEDDQSTNSDGEINKEDNVELCNINQLPEFNQEDDQRIDMVGKENKEDNVESCSKTRLPKPNQEDDQSTDSVCGESKDVDVELCNKSRLPGPNKEDHQRIDSASGGNEEDDVELCNETQPPENNQEDCQSIDSVGG